MTAAARTNSLRFETACLWEAASRKAGNVHPSASFKDVDFVHFSLSGAAAGWIFDHALGKSVGLIVHHAVSETISVIGSNTNLGIVLLIAPLAVADTRINYRGRLQHVLNSLTNADTRSVYEAIRLANPGGLGDAPEQDVRSEPTVTLLEAMKLAADRDMVARQYANGFADVFDFGVPAFLAGFERFGCVEAAIIDSQLRWLAEYPDSLIVRKNGPAVAADVQKRAIEVQALGGIATPEGRRAGVALDRHLRSDGNKLNPGTTADLITACLFVALRENKVVPSAAFRWQVPDWL
jgi:triphosphoribosyl-dephospho-CoA synthase